MTFFKDFINQYGATILYTVLVSIAGYVGIEIKKLYEKTVKDKAVKNVISTCVQAVEQMYKDLDGDEKLNKCIGYASEMLAEKGINISEIEIRVIIEASVNELKNKFNSTTISEGILISEDDSEAK